MEASLCECESEVTKMAQVSFIKTKLPKPGVTLPSQRSFPLNSHASFLFSFFFKLFFSTSFRYHARGSGWWMQQ